MPGTATCAPPAHISWCGNVGAAAAWTSKAAPRYSNAIAVYSIANRAGRRPKGLSQAGSPGRSPPHDTVEGVALALALGIATALAEDVEHLAPGSSRRPHRTRDRR